MLDGRIALTIAACLVWLAVHASRSQRAKRPPGPRRLPFIGNSLRMPQSYKRLTLSRWAKEYGDIVYLEAFGQPVIVLNSDKVAKDLLAKAIYSDRPHLRCNDDWRRQRKIASQDLAPRMVPRYHAFLESEARLLARDLLQDSSKLAHLVKLKAGTILIRISYGHYVSTDDDPFLHNAHQSLHECFQIYSGRRVAVKYLPKWLPGTGFLAKAKSWRDIASKAVWAPYARSKRSLELGSVILPNICSTALEAISGSLSPDLEEQLVWSAGTMTAGGLETLIIGTMNFFLAMMLNPAVQAKAQAEIDSVVGRDRLPTIADQASLPYVRSVVTEVFRLNPPIPLEVFTNPMEFHPDRYQNRDSEMEKVNSVVFGFGRRLCPGKLLAENTLFAIAATVFATCEIVPKVDKNGNEIIPNVTYSSGIFR
ncbi:putative monooxygenase [Mycena rebaudengoi]|nr:putative monooxygenase [Mycena rebaudengoi]